MILDLKDTMFRERSTVRNAQFEGFFRPPPHFVTICNNHLRPPLHLLLLRNRFEIPPSLMNSDISVLQRITKLDKKITFVTDYNHLL